jgi:hypothetical protein
MILIPGVRSAFSRVAMELQSISLSAEIGGAPVDSDAS